MKITEEEMKEALSVNSPDFPMRHRCPKSKVIHFKHLDDIIRSSPVPIPKKVGVIEKS